MDKENNHHTQNVRRQLGSCESYAIHRLNKESDAEHAEHARNICAWVKCQKVAGSRRKKNAVSRRDPETQLDPEKKSSIISTMLGLTILAGMARAVPMTSAMEPSPSMMMEEMINDIPKWVSSESKSKWATTRDTSDAGAWSSSRSEDEVK